MNQEFVDRIAKQSHWVHGGLAMKHREENYQARRELDELVAQCDHTSPDGSSALRDRISLQWCSVCGSWFQKGKKIV